MDGWRLTLALGSILQDVLSLTSSDFNAKVKPEELMLVESVLVCLLPQGAYNVSTPLAPADLQTTFSSFTRFFGALSPILRKSLQQTRTLANAVMPHCSSMVWPLQSART